MKGGKMANNSKQILMTILIAAVVALVVTLLVLNFLNKEVNLGPPIRNDAAKLPDLIVEKAEVVKVNCEENNVCEKVEINYRIKNQGNSPTINSFISTTMQLDDTEGNHVRYTWSTIWGQMGAGKSKDGIAYVSEVPYGRYNLFIQTDDTYWDEAESNEANNEYYIADIQIP